MSPEPRTHRVLLVDDEEDLVWSLVRRLQRALPGASIEGRTRAEDALDALADTEFDLLVTDIRMPNLSGMDLVVGARKRWPALPFVVMSAYPAEFYRNESLRLGSVTFIEKPFELAALVELVQDVFRRKEQSGFSGEVLLETLPDLVQLYVLSNLTGALHLWREGEVGAIWFDRGSITHATSPAAEGVPAFFEVLTWSGGEFSIERGVTSPSVTIFENATGLIMEGLKRLDESRRGDDPDGRAKSVPPNVQSAAEWSAVVETQAEARDPDSRNAQRPPSEQKDEIMSTNIQASLESLRAIDGYVGAALVDSESGMCLGADGGGTLNLEVAAAANTEVVRAKRKAVKALNLRDDIEDILISLGKQYHVIRPLKNRPAVFFYIVVDRTRANLAMTRLSLGETEKKLEL